MQPHSAKIGVKTGVATRTAAPAWRLELLGGAVLYGVAARHTLERKTAGVLAVLALEGEVTRSKVAGLLWADSDEERARGNLRQTLHRLKKLVGTDLVQSGERLSLTDELEVDTITLESKAFLGDDAGLIVVKGEILEPFDFEDCPDFSEWLYAQRERWRGARVSAYRRALQHSESSSDALELASDWVNLEPLSEEAARVLARVYHASGNRGKALQTLQNLEHRLYAELGAKPSFETNSLQESLERNEVVRETLVGILPIDVRNPPRLVGRSREWAQLENAWAKGLGIVTRGVAGVGKSRLMQDFLSSKTKFDLIQARPSDTNLPMSALTRVVRVFQSEQLLTDLPAWVTSELSRLIPELADTPPAPMNTESDKLRFFEAIFKILERRFQQGIRAFALDDLQFMDVASFEALQYSLERLARLGVRTFIAYRTGELSFEIEASLEQASSHGSLEIIDLMPLEEQSLLELVNSLRLEAPSALAAQLQRATDGNPLFALEIIRDLLERNQLFEHQDQLPLPKIVRQIIVHRLERRSATAQRVAQVAAIAGTDFTLELAAFALECKPNDLEDALLELEQAQIMRGEQFQHDLLQEAVHANMGVFIKKFLHRKCADFLEGHGDPARVAQHWLLGDEETRAVPNLLLAAEHSKAQFQIQKACALYRQAGLVLERSGQRNQAFDAFEQAREVLFTHDLGEEIQAVVNDMKRVAKSLEERVKVAHVQAELLTDRQEFATATKIAKHGLELARALGNDVYLSDLEGDLGLLHFYQGQFQEAIAYLERALVYAQRHLKRVETKGDAQVVSAARLLLAISATNFASTLDHVGQYQQAEQYHRQTIGLLRVLGEQQQMLAALSNFAINLMDQGCFTQAREIIEEALGMLEHREDGGGLHVIPLLAAGVDVYLALDEAWLALPQALKAVSQAESLDDPRLPLLQIRLALVWHTLGETERAREMFDAALHSPNQHPVFASRIVRTYAAFLHDLEEDTSALQTKLEAVLLEETSTVRTMQIGLLFARLKDPATRRDYAQKILEQALERGMNGIVIAAYSRLGAVLLELQQPHQALEQTRKAMTLLERFGSEIPKIEVLWTHYRALLANDQTLAASAHLATTWQHLESIKQGLPLEYQQGFLQHNTVNRAILKEAREVGLAQ